MLLANFRPVVLNVSIAAFLPLALVLKVTAAMAPGHQFRWIAPSI
jgi:hypothetical protein